MSAEHGRARHTRVEHTRIAALYHYPIKSGRGIELDGVTLTSAGFADDRRWMVVRPDGIFLTQREAPRLALLRPTLAPAALLLEAPSLEPFSIALAHTGPRRRVRVWAHECEALDEGDEVAAWLARLLGRPCRLVRFDPAHRRLSDLVWTEGHAAENRFSDAYPILTLGTASLADLNRRLARPLPLDRFRPNLVLEGLEPYDEDRIAELEAEGVRLKLVKPCTRCKITTTNQQTAEVEGEEPLRTLKSYRYDRRLRGVCFGQNAIVLEGVGARLERGQRLAVRWKRAAGPER